jgi:hypothetical protein
VTLVHVTACADAASYLYIWDTVLLPPHNGALSAPLAATHSPLSLSPLLPAAFCAPHSWHLKRAARRFVAAALSHCMRPIKLAPAWLSGCTSGLMHCVTWSDVKLQGSWVPAAKAWVAKIVARPSMQPPEPHSSSGLALRHCCGWYVCEVVGVSVACAQFR